MRSAREILRRAARDFAIEVFDNCTSHEVTMIENAMAIGVVALHREGYSRGCIIELANQLCEEVTL
jgi:hypothetical protein